MSALINRQRTLRFGAASLVWAAMCCCSFADESPDPLRSTYPQTSYSEPVNWQGSSPTFSVAPTADVPRNSDSTRLSSLEAPPADQGVAPLLDDGYVDDQQLMLGGTIGEDEKTQRRGVRPYGGGHPTDWPWGCGSSPFRTGPGTCDTYRVGPIWNVAVDGMVMHREDADLGAIADTPFMSGIYDPPPAPQLTEQFDYAPGGRVSLIGKHPSWVGYRVHAGYEGIEAWNAAVIYPKFTPIPGPPAGIADSSEQRRINYSSSLHSGELNILRSFHSDPIWQPYCGVRYMKFDDELQDFIDQESPAPLPGPMPTTVTITDRLNLFDLENQLMGFQVGLRRDYWQINSRWAIEGFVNGGVYYNKIKYTNLMNVTSLTQFADDTDTAANETNQIGTSVTNNESSELSEIAYVGEASISAVCRLNKCWAARAGYQALWIDGVHLAEDAFLDTGVESQSLFFHGWHAGVECRR